LLLLEKLDSASFEPIPDFSFCFLSCNNKTSLNEGMKERESVKNDCSVSGLVMVPFTRKEKVEGHGNREEFVDAYC
jgi:hypothetical protein